MSTFSESSSSIVGSAAELAKLLAEERAKNRQLQQQLDLERQERSRAEALLFKTGRREPAIGEESDSGSDKGKCGSDDSPSAVTAKVLAMHVAGTLGKLTIPELKAYLKSLRLPVGGKKGELEERARQALGGAATGAAAANAVPAVEP